MHHLAFDCEVKLATGDDSTAVGTVEGYAAVFNLMDRGGDVVLPGAFKQSLANWRKKKAMPPMLWQHDGYSPVGVWSELAEDDRGLKATGQLVMDVPQAAIARALIAAGAVKGLSIGYETKDREIDPHTGVRRLKRVDLWEVSLVTFPMNPDAQISGVKGEFDPAALERHLRDEGRLSIRDAKAAVSVFRKHALRDAGSSEPAPRDGASDVLMTLRKAAQSLR